jgi:hypothetical protein
MLRETMRALRPPKDRSSGLRGERNPAVPAGRTSSARIGAGDLSAGMTSVPACRARHWGTGMPWVGASPCVATRADIANRYHWIAILRASRHDYSSSAQPRRATARRASSRGSVDRRSGGTMAVTAQLVPREYRVSEIAEASRSWGPVSPELLEDVVTQTPFEHLLDGPENLHDFLLLRPKLG